MKKSLIKLSGITALSILLATSCRNKEDATTTPEVSDSEMNVSATQASDNENVTANVDEALDNINTDLSSTESGGRSGASEACGFTVNYSQYSTVSGSNQKTIVYTFDKQTVCNSRSRQGTITATLVNGDHFRDKDAVYTLVFDAYGVTYNGKTITLKGTQTVTNLTGGLPKNVINKPLLFPIVTHKTTGSMELTFDTSALKRTWEINRKVSWSNLNGVLSFTVTSENSIDGFDNVAVWGTNRFGNKFYTQILTPLSANSKCGWFRPVSGKRKHSVIDTDGSTYTVESQINVDTEGCGNGYIVTTTNKKGKTRSKTVSY